MILLYIDYFYVVFKFLVKNVDVTLLRLALRGSVSVFHAYACMKTLRLYFRSGDSLSEL